MWRSQSQESDNNEGSNGVSGHDAADTMAQICKSSVLLPDVNSSPLRQKQFLKKSLNSLLSPRKRTPAGGTSRLSHQPASIDESILEEIHPPPEVKFQQPGNLSRSMLVLNQDNGEEASSPVGIVDVCCRDIFS